MTKEKPLSDKIIHNEDMDIIFRDDVREFIQDRLIDIDNFIDGWITITDLRNNLINGAGEELANHSPRVKGETSHESRYPSEDTQNHSPKESKRDRESSLSSESQVTPEYGSPANVQESKDTTKGCGEPFERFKNAFSICGDQTALCPKCEEKENVLKYKSWEDESSEATS